MRKHLYAARNAQHISKKDVASLIGVNEAYYHRLERGDIDGTSWIWESLEEVFDTSISILRRKA